jgi:hypothetical protein
MSVRGLKLFNIRRVYAAKRRSSAVPSEVLLCAHLRGCRQDVASNVSTEDDFSTARLHLIYISQSASTSTMTCVRGIFCCAA